MSARQTAQNSVAERRLRPIYDWLDHGNNKKAFSEACKVLKKQPDLQCAKVLSALALLRLGNEADAEERLDAVHREAPTEDATLQAMTIAYKEMDQTDKIVSLYENATAADPTNEDLLSHLFMSYVRVSKYKEQRNAAMALFKAKPKNPYYFWAVMSIVLQATATVGSEEDPGSKKILLTFAERMVAKMETDNKIDQEQEMHLYLLVMELQSKYEGALKIIDGPLGVRLSEQTSFLNLVPGKRLDYLKKLSRWAQVNALAKKMLIESPDQWSLYLDYIHSVFMLLDSEDERKKADEEVDATSEEADKFFLAQQEKNEKCRGPALARLELEVRKIARKDASADHDKLLSMLVFYFERFGNKSVCFSDIKLYLPSLTVAMQDSFFKQAEATKSEKTEKIDDIHRGVCLHQLRRFLGRHASLNREALLDTVAEMERLYEECQPLVKDYHHTELRPSDMYLIIAGHILWELWVESSDDAFFWRAAVLLEYALKLSPSNFHARFLLVKFYNQAGASGAAHIVYQGLELKHIQLDTLGHLMCPKVLNTWNFQDAGVIFRSALRFFTSNYKEIVEHITTAYRCGTFGKIREFIQMRDRLASSQHYHALTVERMLLDLLLDTQNHSEAIVSFEFLDLPTNDKTKWEELVDNRDFKAMVSWDPLDKSVSDELISESFMLDQTHLQFRELTARSLAAAGSLPQAAKATNGQQNGDSDTITPLSLLRNLIERFESQQSAGAKAKCGQCYLNPVQGPCRPSLQMYLRDGHPTLLLSMLQLVLSAHPDERKAGATEAQLETISKSFGTLVQIQMERLKLPEKQVILRREEIFEAIFNSVESFGHACILLGSCQALMKGGGEQPAAAKGASGGKKGKKKTAEVISPEQVASLTAFNETVAALETHLKTLSGGVAELSKLTALDALSATAQNQMSKMSLTEDKAAGLALDVLQESVAKSLEKSYSASFRQLRGVIKKKEDYLASLKIKL